MTFKEVVNVLDENVSRNLMEKTNFCAKWDKNYKNSDGEIISWCHTKDNCGKQGTNGSYQDCNKPISCESNDDCGGGIFGCTLIVNCINKKCVPSTTFTNILDKAIALGKKIRIKSFKNDYLVRTDSNSEKVKLDWGQSTNSGSQWTVEKNSNGKYIFTTITLPYNVPGVNDDKEQLHRYNTKRDNNLGNKNLSRFTMDNNIFI